MPQQDPQYVTQSDERRLLGGFLVSLGLVSLIVSYVLNCAGFVIFVVLLSGALVLGLPVHKNILRLEGMSVLITGCDTGFGHELAKRLASAGATVYAGCLVGDGDGARKLRELNNDKLNVVQLDVTKDDQVQTVVDHITDKSGDLWAVVNNAGAVIYGDVDIVTMHDTQTIIDINLNGTVRVTKACLSLLKKSKGRVVNVTSVRGISAFPFNSHYCMSKFGGEAFSDCLRMEMTRFGVHVVIVEPSNFGGITSLNKRTLVEGNLNRVWETMNDEQRREYGRDYIDQHINNIINSCKTTSSPTMEPVIDAMEEAVRAQNPQYRYHVGGGNGLYDVDKWIGVLRPYIPTSLVDKYLMDGTPRPNVLQ